MLRLAGVLVCAMLTLEGLARDLPALPVGVPDWVSGVALGFVALVFVAFGILFWVNTREPATVVSRRRIALLAVQIGLALILSTDLLYLVAAEVPLVMPPRAAARWITIQLALTTVAGVLLARTDGFEVASGYATLPRATAVVLTLVGVLAGQGFTYCAGYMAATEARSRSALARLNAELRGTQALLADSSRLAERVQISRELHDTIGHHLTVLSVNLELARQLAGSAGGGDRALQALSEAQDVTRLLLSDVRAVVGALREDRSIDLRLALEGLAAGTTEPHVHLAFPSGVAVRDPAQAHALFRCAQEAITNTVRHAGARNLWIEVATSPDGGLELSARDDGQGAGAVEPGNGLRGMRERLEEVGGRLRIEAAPRGGFALHASLPASLGPGEGAG